MTSPTPNVTANDDAARAAGERETGMSDRTPSSVRTGDVAAPKESVAPAEPVPVSATQSIPTTGSQRAQSPTAGTTPATAAPPSGAAVQPGGGPPGAPPVPPPTGADATTPARGRGRGSAKSRGPRRARLQLRHIDTWSARWP